jgi:hypothetical protein
MIPKFNIPTFESCSSREIQMQFGSLQNLLRDGNANNGRDGREGRAYETCRKPNPEELRLELEGFARKSPSLTVRRWAVSRLQRESDRTLTSLLENPNEHPLIKAEALWNPNTSDSALLAVLKRSMEEAYYVRYTANLVSALRRIK